jgi:hypothetical protein
MNGVIAVNTTGIRTDTNCITLKQIGYGQSLTDPMTFVGTPVGDCPFNVTFELEPQDAGQESGVVSVPNYCGSDASSPAFDPVRKSPLFSLWVALGCSFRLGCLLDLGT